MALSTGAAAIIADKLGDEFSGPVLILFVLSPILYTLVVLSWKRRQHLRTLGLWYAFMLFALAVPALPVIALAWFMTLWILDYRLPLWLTFVALAIAGTFGSLFLSGPYSRLIGLLQPRLPSELPIVYRTNPWRAAALPAVAITSGIVSWWVVPGLNGALLVVLVSSVVFVLMVNSAAILAMEFSSEGFAGGR